MKKHIKRFTQKVLNRPSSSVGTEQDTSSGSSPAASTANRNEPRARQQQYGLFEFETHDTQPTPAGSERFPIDIIAVHGLGGDSYKTWTHRSTGKLWLRDFLPGFLPGCRVYTFGYPSKLTDVNMRAGVQDFGRKLLGAIRDHIEDSSEVRLRIVLFSS